MAINRHEEQVRTIVENWANSVREKDIAGILAHHTSDLLMFDVPPPFQSKGLKEYTKTWEIFFAWQKDSRVFDILDMTVVAGEDTAFCYATMRCGGYGHSGQKEELQFRLTIGLKKVSGEWMIQHEHHSIPAE